MSSKKDIIDELKKFNKDLENHLPNLDFDFLKEINEVNAKAGSSTEENEEYFSLLANNLMELRTEIALTRKNLTTDIEGMVLRTINEQQGKFFEQIKKFYGVILLEIKENFSSNLNTLAEEMSTIKRKHNEMVVQQENVNSMLEEMSMDMKDMHGIVSDLKDEGRKGQIVIRKQFEEMQEKFEQLSKELHKNKGYLDDHLIKMNKRFAHMEHYLDDIQALSLSYTKSDVSVSQDEHERSTASSRHHKPEAHDGENWDAVSHEKKKEDAKKKILSSKLDKILDIDEKLDKLNSLR